MSAIKDLLFSLTGIVVTALHVTFIVGVFAVGFFIWSQANGAWVSVEIPAVKTARK